MKTFIIMQNDGCDVLLDSQSCVRLDSRLGIYRLMDKGFEIYNRYKNWKKGTVNGFRIITCCSLLDDNFRTICQYKSILK